MLLSSCLRARVPHGPRSTILGLGLGFLSLSLICLASSSLFPHAAEASVGLSFGLAALEEGDERMRPTAVLEADLGEDWSLILQNYGRVQAPAQQTSYLFAATRNYPIFGFKTFKARVGGALAYETTRLSRADGSIARSDSKNLGLFLGLNWQSGSRLFATFDWGTAIFPAGAAVLFLTTARKQSISAGMGWRL